MTLLVSVPMIGVSLKALIINSELPVAQVSLLGFHLYPFDSITSNILFQNSVFLL